MGQNVWIIQPGELRPVAHGETLARKLSYERSHLLCSQGVSGKAFASGMKRYLPHHMGRNRVFFFGERASKSNFTPGGFEDGFYG